MRERLTDEQVQNAKLGSAYLEEAWRVRTFPQNHPAINVELADNFIEQQANNMKIDIRYGDGTVSRETYEAIFTGIYHHGLSLPAKIRFQNPNLN